ncbi:MAG: acetate uptake transporter [Trichloromonas sp.]|nr:acetate uptake transporter [Trichloromonas sp.]
MLNTSHLSRAGQISATESNITSFGLFGFGLCAILVNLFEAGLFPVAPVILAMGVSYGGLSQIVVGLMEWQKQNVFGAITFVSFGLFWLSLVGLLVLPEAGLGTPPQGMILSAYLLFWWAFSALLLASAVKVSRLVRGMFFLLLGYFGLYFLGEVTATPVLTRLAHFSGLAGGLAALAAAAELIVRQIIERASGR